MQKGIYVVDCRYIEAVQTAFGELGIFLPSVCCTELAEPVSCHPDMALYPAGAGTVICAPLVFEEYSRILSPFGINLVQGKNPLYRDYPGDVAYNVLNADGCAFARWDVAEGQIAALLDSRGIRRISVAQGYSRCSSLAVGKGVITADPSISEAAEQAGFAVLSIQAGHIRLPGYDYGFIGGASGVLEGKTVAFFGSLDTHPDGEKIRQFVEMQGFICLDVPGQPLIDIGTILCLNYV